MNELTTAQETLLPLNREELAAFYQASMMAMRESMEKMYENFNTALRVDRKQTESMMSDMRIMQNERLDGIAKSLADISGALAGSQKELAGVLGTLANNIKAEHTKETQKSVVTFDPVFYTQRNPRDQRMWINDSKSKIASMAKKMGYPEVAIYKKIYAEMSSAGYDIDKLFEKYQSKNPGAGKISMCAASDILSNLFECKANNIFMGFKNNEGSRAKMPVNLSNGVPADVAEIVRGLRADGKLYPISYKIVKKMIHETPEINEEQLIKYIKEKYHVEKCNLWHAISLSPAAKHKLKNLVSYYAKEKNHG